MTTILLQITQIIVSIWRSKIIDKIDILKEKKKSDTLESFSAEEISR